MEDVFGEVVQSMPVQLVEPVERMINRDVRYRPTMQSFMSVSAHPSVCLSVSLYLCHSFCASACFRVTTYNYYKTAADSKQADEVQHAVCE